MRPLPETWTKWGIANRVIQREGNVVMVEQTQGGVVLGHEVAIVQQHESRTIAGVEIPADEAMPHSEAWGRLGWTYRDKDAAECRFRMLCASQDASEAQGKVMTAEGGCDAL